MWSCPQAIRDKVFHDLLIEIAKGDIQAHHFSRLLLEVGVCFDDVEWEVANKLLEKSDQILAFVPPDQLPQ